MKINRYVTWFDSSTEELVGRIEISNEIFAKIRALLCYPDNHPMCDMYPLKFEVIKAVLPASDDLLSINNCKYYLESDES